MIIYHNVEIANRELDSKLLCAIFSSLDGNTSFISYATEFNFAFLFNLLPPGFYHTKSIAPSKTQLTLLPKLKQRLFKISSIDEESGLLSANFHSFGSRRYSPATLQYTDFIFTWGDHDLNYLVSNFSPYRDQFIKTGSPRVDLWSATFSSCYHKPHPRKYILIPSNFGINTPLPMWKNISNLKNMGYPIDRNFLKKYLSSKSEQILLLDSFIEMITSLSQSFPDFDIIIRPHPVESPEAWMLFTSELSNVFVKSTFTLTDWIHHASLIIHHGCTSAVESIFIGKPVISFLTNLNLIHQPSIPNLVGFRADSIDCLLDQAKIVLQTSNMNSHIVNIPTELSSRFYRNPDYASKVMSDCWNSQHSYFSVDGFSRLTLLMIKLLLAILPVALFALKVFRRQNPFLDDTVNKFPFYSQRYISEKVHSLCQALDFPEVSIIFLSPRCFVVSPMK